MRPRLRATRTLCYSIGSPFANKNKQSIARQLRPDGKWLLMQEASGLRAQPLGPPWDSKRGSW
eukprot:1823180-Alexandrium_andersonii.AAC.1